MGPVCCNLFLGDEINRTSPKTQSALLQVMEESAVTIDGKTIPMPQPFIVIATENPVGSAGTQLLPESQMDRFMVCLSMGYPDMKDEIEIVKGKFSQNSLNDVQAVMNADRLLSLREEVNGIYVHDNIYQYVGKLVTATRSHDMITLGVSPRGTIALVRMAKAYAYICGRDYVIPEDVAEVFADVARHRLVLSSKARIGHVSADRLLDDILKNTKKPSVREKR
jgi:MoxR-like ATPase